MEYSFIIWKIKYKIKNQYELAEIFNLTKWNNEVNHEIHWSIIMQLDEDLLKIINSYDWLIYCLKYLDKDNYLLLLLKIWDNLVNIFWDSIHLTEVLSKIRWNNNKITIIKKLRFKGLSSLIRDAWDIWKILEFLYWKAQREFLDILWWEFLKHIFWKTNQIIIILHFLTDENKDYLMNIIWLESTKLKVKTYKDLLIVFRWFTHNTSLEFLKLFTKKELLYLFISQKEFEYFLLRIPIQKEKIFLEYINS